MQTVLIADDERIIREGIVSTVDWKRLGVSRVLQAADGHEAYERIRRDRPDIAIVDIIMPGLSGIEIITRFQGDRRAPEFVILSAHDEFNYAREAIRCSVNDYLLKPCGRGDIEAAIRRVIARLKERRSLDAERAELRDYIDFLLPQAREQTLRDRLLGLRRSDDEWARRTLGLQCEALHLILLALDEPDDGRLALLKEAADRARFDAGHVCVVVRDAVALALEAQEEEASDSAVIRRALGDHLKERLDPLLKRTGLATARAAIGGKGRWPDLPQLYRRAREALKLPPPVARPLEGLTVQDASTARCSFPVRQVMEYVEEHLADRNLSLNYIAANVLFLNSDYLGKLFKKECGVRFSEYLLAVRMERAKRILAGSPDAKVYEVAAQVGLGDHPAYFGQVFRRYTGMRPSEYRRMRAAGR